MNKKNIIRTNSCNSWTLLLFSFLFFISSFIYAQDFGFGFEDTEETSGVSFSFEGEVGIEFPFYFKDYKFNWEELLSADINLKLDSKYIQVFTGFSLSYDSISEFWDKDADWGKFNHTPLFIDEAYAKIFIGPVDIEAGLRKLTWGKADSSGPLDVTNPVDFTDLRYITDLQAQKIARPMLHISFNTGNFSKLEGVFIPNFAPHRFAQEGRWMPNQISKYEDIISAEIKNQINSKWDPVAALGLWNALLLPSRIQSSIKKHFNNNDIFESSDTDSIDNFQAGLRYTTTIGSADFGGQYYYGNLFKPSVTIYDIEKFVDGIIASNASSINPALISPQIKYTRYHQIGIDYAQVLAGFNVRAETAVNLTEDITGKDGRYQNPFFAWSLGFDRDLFWGINLNIQCNETIRFMNSKIGDDPLFDCEAGTNITNTRLTTRLSKSFFRDKLETIAVCIWDIENSDCYIIPSVSYSLNDFIFNVTAGFFVGNEKGELGQYRDNNFIRVGAVYKF